MSSFSLRNSTIFISSSMVKDRIQPLMYNFQPAPVSFQLWLSLSLQSSCFTGTLSSSLSGVTFGSGSQLSWPFLLLIRLFLLLFLLGTWKANFSSIPQVFNQLMYFIKLYKKPVIQKKKPKVFIFKKCSKYLKVHETLKENAVCSSRHHRGGVWLNHSIWLIPKFWQFSYFTYPKPISLFPDWIGVSLHNFIMWSYTYLQLSGSLLEKVCWLMHQLYSRGLSTDGIHSVGLR